MHDRGGPVELQAYCIMRDRERRSSAERPDPRLRPRATMISSVIDLDADIAALRGDDDDAIWRALNAMRTYADSIWKNSIWREGGIPLLVALLKRGSLAQKLSALGLLATIADSACHEIKVAIREAGCITAAVDLLSTVDATHDATELLYRLSTLENAKDAIREAGGIPPIVRFFVSGGGGSSQMIHIPHRFTSPASRPMLLLKVLLHNNDNNEVAIALARGRDEMLVHLAWRSRVVFDGLSWFKPPDPHRFNRFDSADALSWNPSAGAQRKAKLVIAALVCKRNWQLKRLDFPAIPHVLNTAIASFY